MNILQLVRVVRNAWPIQPSKDSMIVGFPERRNLRFDALITDKSRMRYSHGLTSQDREPRADLRNCAIEGLDVRHDMNPFQVMGCREE